MSTGKYTFRSWTFQAWHWQSNTWAGAGDIAQSQPVDGWITRTRKRHWMAATRVRLWIAGSR